MAKCVLEIRDEVNVKFVGLDVKTRRAISDAAKYFLPYAYHMPAYKLGRWDGCIRFCDIGGRTFINLLDRLLPIVTKEGYNVDVANSIYTDPTGELVATSAEVWEAVVVPEVLSDYTQRKRSYSTTIGKSNHIELTLFFDRSKSHGI